MTTRIPAELRLLVATRAGHLCEYCLIHEDDTYVGCQVDHIISEKHGGPTVADNLAYACAFCNRAKGSDVGSLTTAGEFMRFFNPRTDQWAEHFVLDGNRIEALSPQGDVTLRILGCNGPERLIERAKLMQLGRYPPIAARIKQ
jgi:hypothetical protein